VVIAKLPAKVVMPILLRFLVVLAVLAGLGFAIIYALATPVQPDVREIVVPIPPDRLPPGTR